VPFSKPYYIAEFDTLLSPLVPEFLYTIHLNFAIIEDLEISRHKYLSVGLNVFF
jgi:hypothetical protein